MILPLLEVVLPVFIIVGAGYCTVRFKILTDLEINAVLKFTQTIGIPIFLFLSMLTLDLKKVFNWEILTSYYLGAIICFLLGIVGSKKYLNCSNTGATVIGFNVLFCNAVLLGLPITTLAYGEQSISINLGIISVNAPICYFIGISFMEFTNKKSRNFHQVTINILKTITSNNITMGLILGLLFNVIEIQLAQPIYQALSLISIGALSTALFSLGGVLVAYNLTKNLSKIILIIFLSLFIHPVITMYVGSFYFTIPSDILKNAILTSAMGPGINAFIFASIYKIEMEVTASAILICTPISIFTSLLWISIF